MLYFVLEQIQFGRVVIPNLLTLLGNPGSNLILVTEIEIQFVFPDESRKLPRIQLRGNIFLRQLSVASFAIDHPSRGQTYFLYTPIKCYTHQQNSSKLRQQQKNNVCIALFCTTLTLFIITYIINISL